MPRPPDDDDRVCENCGRWIEPNETLYRVELKLFADPRPADVDLDMSREQAAAEWDALIARMESMNDDQVAEATDQVHEQYAYCLCPQCRGELHARLKARRRLM